MKKQTNFKKQAFDFQDLMVNRIHNILLVASPYDAFILEEDGRLTEQILTEYIGMNFNYAPRVTQASTAADALALLNKRKFDLVIVMLRIEDTDPISLGASIKKNYPRKPVVLLLFDESELKQLSNSITPASIDRVFIWSGDAAVFPAIIKYFEDRRNAKRDILKGDVRAIIVIEDSPRMYSTLLPLIYREIIYHTRHLTDKSLNNTKRLLHLRGRPKVLFTPNFETAQKFFKKFRHNTFGIISDIQFLQNGEENSGAGFSFLKWVRKIEPSIPVLLHSTDNANKKTTEALGAQFVHKYSPTFLQELREFMIGNFGFGDFIFRGKNGRKLMSVSSIPELIKAIEKVNVKSLHYHGKFNHFSNWLAARTEFGLASKIRAMNLSDFKTEETLRTNLLKALNAPEKDSRKSQILDYLPEHSDGKGAFYRLSGGSLGGKARGLAFARYMIQDETLSKQFPNMKIRIPKTAVIGTDEFDRFMNDNNLWEKTLKAKSDKIILKYFLKSELSIDLRVKLHAYLQVNTFPLAVRSSSLLEDSQYQPLAGAYETFMLSNSHSDIQVKLEALCVAIKKVFASTFYQNAKSLMKKTNHRIEEEKMAVIIMEISGQDHEGKFYPTISGVAQSYNYYPVSYMERDEGVAYLALGFGRTIVDGEKCLRISPKYPGILPQFYSIRTMIQNSQHQFYALDLKKQNEKSDLNAYKLSVAEKDGVLKWLGSVISSEDQIVRDSLGYAGTRIVSFAPILNWKLIPLPEMIEALLKIAKASMGCPVDIEFAVNIKQNESVQAEFSLLQIKPMSMTNTQTSALLTSHKDELFCKSHVTLGNGNISDIKDIIFVRPETFDTSKTQEIAREISELNKQFKSNQYVLAGPGRWGSADHWLGIPVEWEEISKAQVIIEIGMKDQPIDPSFGSHFFQNLTSLRVGYFTVDAKRKDDFIDNSWLKSCEIHQKGEYVDWIKLDQELQISIDGMTGIGTIYKPISPELELMDEDESPGI
jgi:hypothetical protein